jgi:plastocyanin
MKVRVVSILGGTLALIITVWACGGGSDKSPTSPTTPATTPPTGPAPATVAVTITASGVSVSAIDLAVGGVVTFTNSDNRAHEMASDPHPNHTDCPAINAVGVLQPGESRATAALSTARRCGFHDHMNPGTTSLLGAITTR